MITCTTNMSSLYCNSSICIFTDVDIITLVINALTAIRLIYPCCFCTGSPNPICETQHFLREMKEFAGRRGPYIRSTALSPSPQLLSPFWISGLLLFGRYNAMWSIFQIFWSIFCYFCSWSIFIKTPVAALNIVA